jgi:hypothetical protein
MSDFSRLMEAAREAGVAISAPSVSAIPAVMPLTAAVGDTLTCTMGEWTGEPDSYTYSWQHGGDPTEIGTGDTYTTVAGDADTSVQCVVTATNTAGSAAAPPSNSVAVSAAATMAASASHESKSESETRHTTRNRS